jgi:hypothetical protein
VLHDYVARVAACLCNVGYLVRQQKESKALWHPQVQSLKLRPQRIATAGWQWRLSKRCHFQL